MIHGAMETLSNGECERTLVTVLHFKVSSTNGAITNTHALVLDHDSFTTTLNLTRPLRTISFSLRTHSHILRSVSRHTSPS